MQRSIIAYGILFVFLLKSVPLHASSPLSDADPDNYFKLSNNSFTSMNMDRQSHIDSRQSRWAVEASLTFHIVRIYMLKFSYKYSDRVELGIGPAFQNWKNEDDSFLGQANAYTLLLSYRYYFWRKFNVEIELWPAWNHFKSFIDNNTYKGLELWAEYKLGYRLDLGQRIYLNIQPGIGHPVWMQNKWPGVEEYDSFFDLLRNETIFVPQLMLGFRF